MKKIDSKLLNQLNSKAENSTRKRINHNFHKESGDLLQRMLNAMEPGTYIQPHKHENPDKREVFLVLKGSFVVVEFDEAGIVTDHIILDSEKGIFGAEVAPGVYHTIIPLEQNSVAYEVKDGPYNVESDKNFAPWAPSENSGEGPDYNKNLLEKLQIIPNPIQ